MQAVLVMSGCWPAMQAVMVLVMSGSVPAAQAVMVMSHEWLLAGKACSHGHEWVLSVSNASNYGLEWMLDSSASSTGIGMDTSG